MRSGYPQAAPPTRRRGYDRAPPMVPVLRHRDFRLLFTGQAVSVLGDALLPVALAFAVLDGLDGQRRPARARARRPGRADDVPRPPRRRVGGPDAAPRADARQRPRPRGRAGAHRRAAAHRPRAAVAADRAVGGLRRARGVLPPGRGRAHARAGPARGAPAGERARRPLAERGPRPRPGGRRRAAGRCSRPAPRSPSTPPRSWSAPASCSRCASRRAPRTRPSTSRTSGASSPTASARSGGGAGCSPSCRASRPTT